MERVIDDSGSNRCLLSSCSSNYQEEEKLDTCTQEEQKKSYLPKWMLELKSDLAESKALAAATRDSINNLCTTLNRVKEKIGENSNTILSVDEENGHRQSKGHEIDLKFMDTFEDKNKLFQKKEKDTPNNEKNCLELLPHDIMVQGVFPFLTIKDIIQISCISSKYQKYIQEDDNIWDFINYNILPPTFRFNLQKKESQDHDNDCQYPYPETFFKNNLPNRFRLSEKAYNVYAFGHNSSTTFETLGGLHALSDLHHYDPKAFLKRRRFGSSSSSSPQNQYNSYSQRVSRHNNIFSSSTVKNRDFQNRIKISVATLCNLTANFDFYYERLLRYSSLETSATLDFLQNELNVNMDSVYELHVGKAHRESLVKKRLFTPSNFSREDYFGRRNENLDKQVNSSHRKISDFPLGAARPSQHSTGARNFTFTNLHNTSLLGCILPIISSSNANYSMSLKELVITLIGNLLCHSKQLQKYFQSKLPYTENEISFYVREENEEDKNIDKNVKGTNFMLLELLDFLVIRQHATSTTHFDLKKILASYLNSPSARLSGNLAFLDTVGPCNYSNPKLNQSIAQVQVTSTDNKYEEVSGRIDDVLTSKNDNDTNEKNIARDNSSSCMRVCAKQSARTMLNLFRPFDEQIPFTSIFDSISSNSFSVLTPLQPNSGENLSVFLHSGSEYQLSLSLTPKMKKLLWMKILFDHKSGGEKTFELNSLKMSLLQETGNSNYKIENDLTSALYHKGEHKNVKLEETFDDLLLDEDAPATRVLEANIISDSAFKSAVYPTQISTCCNIYQIEYYYKSGNLDMKHESIFTISQSGNWMHSSIQQQSEAIGDLIVSGKGDDSIGPFLIRGYSQYEWNELSFYWTKTYTYNNHGTVDSHIGGHVSHICYPILDRDDLGNLSIRRFYGIWEIAADSKDRDDPYELSSQGGVFIMTATEN